MKTSVASSARQHRSSASLLGLGLIGCMLAVLVGASAATSHANLVAGALVSLAFCGAWISIYFRDPVGALIGLWLIVVFNAPVSASVGYFSSAGEAVRQSDEILMVIFVCLTLWQTMRANARIPPLRFILPGAGVALCGVLGAAHFGVPLTTTLVGAWLALKLWLIIGIAVLLPWKPTDLTRIYRVVTWVGVLVAVVGLADYATHEAISRALGTSIYRFSSERFRGEAVHSIFPHPGEFSVFMSMLFGLAFARFASQRNKADLAMALLFAVSIMLSLRLKGFLSLAVVMAIIAFVQGLANPRRAIAISLVGALLIAGAYGVEGSVINKQLNTYADSSTTARSRLYTVGDKIASADFPLGAGFGRFASYASRIYYSPVYQQYELNTIWGLSRRYPQFIDDTSWPSVIGETGYGGLVLYLIGIAVVVLAVIKRLRTAPAATKWVPLATLCVLAAFLIDSLGEATLFDWLSVMTLAILLGPLLVTIPDSVPASGTSESMSG